MLILVLGLLLFLGVHSVRIAADDWRSAQIARRGPGPWKAAYSVLSIVGFVLIVWGYVLARHDPVFLWSPPVWTRHLAALLMLVSFVLFAAVYLPGNTIKARLRHPMVLGVKVWALAHLLSNGTLADVVLFGAFLVWAVLSFRAARGRDRVAGAAPAAVPGSTGRTAAVVVIGVAAAVLFAGWLHGPLIGVQPFAR